MAVSNLYYRKLAPDEVRCSRFFTFISGPMKPRKRYLLRYRVRERDERENRKSDTARHSSRLQFFCSKGSMKEGRQGGRGEVL